MLAGFKHIVPQKNSLQERKQITAFPHPTANLVNTSAYSLPVCFLFSSAQDFRGQTTEFSDHSPLVVGPGGRSFHHGLRVVRNALSLKLFTRL